MKRRRRTTRRKKPLPAESFMPGSTIDQVRERQHAAELELHASYEELAALSDRRSMLDRELQPLRTRLFLLSDELQRMRRRPSQQFMKRGLAGFFTPGLTQEGEDRIAELEAQIAAIRLQCESVQPEINRIGVAMSCVQRRMSNSSMVVSLCSDRIEILTKEVEAEAIRLQKEKRKRDHLASLRAVAAKAKGKDRKLAATVRKKLDLQKECPYCGGPLGDKPHADHIYPLAMGGQSVDWNMVLVCSVCNSSKGALTLSEFVVVRAFDENAVRQRLLALGKRV